VNIYQRVLSSFQLRSELFELKIQRQQIAEKIADREYESSSELLQLWQDQLKLIDQVKETLKEKLNNIARTDIEQLYDETTKLVQLTDEINSKLVNQLYTETFDRLKIKETCKHLMNNTASWLIALNDFLYEILEAINAEQPIEPIIEQYMKEEED